MSARRAGPLVALFLGGLALRPQLGVGPLIPTLQRDLGVPHAVAGLLGTIPVLCMGVFAFPAGRIARSVGSERAIAACLAAIVVFGIARAVAPGAWLVVLLTVPIGIAMGVAGALLPVAVKERFPSRPAFATGVYTLGIAVGATATAALAVPIAQSAGGWRGALAAFSLATAPILAGWALLTRGNPPAPLGTAAVTAVRIPWRSSLAWRLVVAFAALGLVYYGFQTWLPDAFVERGWSEARAGDLLAAFNGAALVTTLLVPWLADRAGSRRAYLLGAGIVLLGGTLGTVLVPAGGFLFAVLSGLGNGALFPLLLTLPLDVADRPDRVGAVAGMVLGIGYTISGIAPFVLGAVRDATGSFTETLWTTVAATALLLVLSLPLSPERLRGTVFAGP